MENLNITLSTGFSEKDVEKKIAEVVPDCISKMRQQNYIEENFVFYYVYQDEIVKQNQARARVNYNVLNPYK